MNNVLLFGKTKKTTKLMLWLLVCFSLMFASCTGSTVEEAIPGSAVESEPLTLPEEIVLISDFGLGIANISGTVKEETLDWMELPMNQYAVVLVDAVPFLTTQPDLSDLRIYKTASLNDDGGYAVDLPQQLADDNDMQVMMLTVENQDCLIPGNQLFYCWDAELSSIAFEDSSQSSIIDGQVLVWAADDGQSFPESIGTDGKYFTDDDELKSLQPGYTIVDLGATPFAFDHQAEGEMALFSNYDSSTGDLSELTYTEAFERIFNDMREGYAFNGVEGKEPDWDAVYELIYPQVQAAEEKEDVNDWISALNAYTQQFSDSHVSISGDVVDDWVEEKYSHGYIFYFNLLSNGDMVYTRGIKSQQYAENERNIRENFVKSWKDENYNNNLIYNRNVLSNSDLNYPFSINPNIENERFVYYIMGYKLSEIYKTPIQEKINDVVPIFGSYSNPDMYYRAQVRDITHTFVEKGPKFGLENFFGYSHEDMYKFADAYVITSDVDYSIAYDPSSPVVTYHTDTGIGVLVIHSDEHDLKTTLDLFEKSLAQFAESNVQKIMIDMRDSDENRFINYAGFFSTSDLMIGEMDWNQFGAINGKPRIQKFVSHPQDPQYSFEKIAILTGEKCKDACEADVYALGLLPQTTIYGETSTFGSFSITVENPYILPGEIYFNFSTGLIKDENNNLLIEGSGVPIDVPLEERLSTYLNDYDWRLSLLNYMVAYENELNIVPNNGPQPLKLSEAEANDLIDEIEQRDIEYLSIDAYPALYQPINYEYRVFVQDPGKLIVSKKWCTEVPDLTINKGEEMNLEFIVDGSKVDEDYLHTNIIFRNDYKCWVKFAVLDNWEPGKHLVRINTEITGRFFEDGIHWYDEGYYTDVYTVVVKESE